MKKFILALTFIAITGFSFAITGTPDETPNVISLKGVIVDELTGEPLSGVKVVLQGSGTFAYTDLDGNFTIQASKNDVLTLEISYISYKSKVTWLDWNQALQNNVKFSIQPE